MGLLAQSTRGVLKQKPIIILYGSGGLGKSTFASQAPNPYAIDIEGSTLNLNVTRTHPANYKDVVLAVEALVNETHDYKSVSIDTLDVMEQFLHRSICETDNVTNIEKAEGGYGKAYKACIQYYATLQKQLRALQAKDIQVILLCHDIMTTYKDPTTDNDYSRFRLKLNDSAAASSAKFWYDFADVVLFAKRKAVSIGDTGRAMDAGGHFIYTQGRAAFDAKSRYQVPFEIPLRWDAWDAALNAKARDESAIRASIASLTTEIKDASIVAKIGIRLGEVKSIPELNAIETRIKEILSTQGV